MKSYYEILEVEVTATQEEIKLSYRRLSAIHHPDKNGDEEKFKLINEAYSCLKDEKKRSHYDKFGEASNRRQDLGEIQSMLNQLLDQFLQTGRSAAQIEIALPTMIADGRRNTIEQLIQKKKVLKKLRKLHRNYLSKENELVTAILYGKRTRIVKELLSARHALKLLKEVELLLESYKWEGEVEESQTLRTFRILNLGDGNMQFI